MTYISDNNAATKTLLCCFRRINLLKLALCCDFNDLIGNSIGSINAQHHTTEYVSDRGLTK
jgi:hypothetical protein